MGRLFCLLLTDTILKEKEPEKPAEEAGESGYNIRGVILLLAEDNDLNAEIAELLLTDAGAKVTIDGDGKQAVDRFSSDPPVTYDAILMDIMMPLMDGLTATGMNAHLAKPLDIEKVIATVARFVNRS